MVTRDNASSVLLKYRSEKKITQEQLSKKTGLSVQTISKIEAGKVKPQYMTVFQLNEYFKTFVGE